MKKLPKGFCEKERPLANKQDQKEIIPFNFSKEVIEGKKKLKIKLIKSV